ncbi:MAG: SCP2 sterol-binding domain-containing protein [Burkholderiales bacterium]|nr:SCP2 sterol-binding domain-containing protein [Burkholderiales bacterium]MDE2456114.1 SCP2 sterol-binding domain-containing protein [Burkholderiales bacterium]
MTTHPGRPALPPGMPAWLAPLHERVRAVVERLPTTPPSFVAARLLDRFLLPCLPADARAALTGQCIELRVTDLGLRVRLRLEAAGFAAAGESAQPVLSIAAPIASYVRLARGDEDPDRLFFERALVMEGDTELGLVLKNTLDAIGPLWPPRR